MSKKKERQEAEMAAEPEANQDTGAKPEVVEIEESEKPGELEELMQRYLRLAAEYDNFRKRSQKEREGVFSDAKALVITAFLPVFDNLERALKQETSDEAYKKGVEMITRQLLDVFEKFGVSEIPTDAFDPELHDAVMHCEDESLGESAIIEVFQKGFIMGDRVLRHAMCRVAN